jgi:hypothetical protein
MKRVLSILVFMTFFTLPASGTLLIQQEDTWDYCVLDFQLRTELTSIEYSDFDWDNADWIEGKAAFGSGREPRDGTINTTWIVGTDIALRKSFEIESIPTENLRLDLAIDNGCVIFVNGQEVAEFMGELFTYLWEYSIEISPEYLQLGANTVSVLAEDHGGATYFDMQLEVVPEPTTICLLGMGTVIMLRKTRRRI